MPDSTRNSQACHDRPAGRAHSLRRLRMPAVTTRITRVRRKGARWELIPATPSLPNSAVSAAKNAEPSANSSQLSRRFMPGLGAAGGLALGRTALAPLQHLVHHRFYRLARAALADLAVVALGVDQVDLLGAELRLHHHLVQRAAAAVFLDGVV